MLGWVLYVLLIFIMLNCQCIVFGVISEIFSAVIV